MDVPPEQAETVELLHRLAGVEPVETHISLVFVGRETVWKLKKALRLSFLDFTAVEARRRFAERELELNAPAAAGLYRDVVPVVRLPDGRLGLGEPGQSGADAVDWVLRMARVPPEDFLDEIAAAGRLTIEGLDALGDAVAAYHQALAPIRSFDQVAALRAVTLGNARAAQDAGLPSEQVDAWTTGAVALLDGIAGWLTRRAVDGFVRRAHGDLHLGNLCLWQGRPVPFDALEFDEALATIDLGYDLGFLLMDLEQRVGRAAANRVLNRYVARTGDAGMTRGMPLFLSLRAMIRAHVEAKRGRAEPAARYLAAAAAYLHPAPAVVVAIGGLPGTGKSTLARALAPDLGGAPGALVLRSDEIRKRQHGVLPEDRLPPAAYSEAASAAVLAELTDGVALAASGGHSVIADATCIEQRDRTLIEEAAARSRVRFVGLWLEAPFAVLAARIAARQGDASDATIAVLRAMSRAQPGAGSWVSIDAGREGAPVAAARAAINLRQ